MAVTGTAITQVAAYAGPGVASLHTNRDVGARTYQQTSPNITPHHCIANGIAPGVKGIRSRFHHSMEPRIVRKLCE